MTRACLLFAALLMVSALALVTVRFESRVRFIALDRLQNQAQELEAEWHRLHLARAQETRQTRIDRIARQTLGMQPRTPERVIYVKPGAQP